MYSATSATAWSSHSLPFSTVATVASPTTPDSVQPLQAPLTESGPSFQSIHTFSDPQSGISRTARSICTRSGLIAR